MYHFMFDGFQGHRSRLDDILLMHETLERLPKCLGIETTMPPIVTPYYNGFEPEDCGLSGFVFLPGGHFTLHTFSMRETIFADILTLTDFNPDAAESVILNSFPCSQHVTFLESRNKCSSYQSATRAIDETKDFGPHLLIKYPFNDSTPTMDWLFSIMDALPAAIGMTPIMRPYILSNTLKDGESVLSCITMIAESHIATHVYSTKQTVYFDIFSCKFFEYATVLDHIDKLFQSSPTDHVLISRGKQYTELKSKACDRHNSYGNWRKYCIQD